jgi:hypothetical protein
VIEIRNILFQPISLHLAGQAKKSKGLHLGPRERCRIENDQYSLDIEKAMKRGTIKVIHLPDPPATPDQVNDEPPAEPSGADQAPTTRKRK